MKIKCKPNQKSINLWHQVCLQNKLRKLENDTNQRKIFDNRKQQIGITKLRICHTTKKASTSVSKKRT